MTHSDSSFYADMQFPASMSKRNVLQWEAISNHIAQSSQLNREFYPQNRYELQPLHTVYIPADQFHENVLNQWSNRALEFLEQFREEMPHLAPLMPESQLYPWEKYHTSQYQTERYDWIKHQLSTAPIKDMRIDFEDGYGHRSTEEEWKCAQKITADLKQIYSSDQSMKRSKVIELTPPAWVGVRTKGLVLGEYHKVFDTLTAVIPLLGAFPGGIITFPKIMDTFQVEAANILCEVFEDEFDLTPGTLRYELQIEIPRALLGHSGEITLAQFINQAGSRLLGFPFGTYDYTAALSIAAPFQSLEHHNADWAKSLMQVAVAGRNTWLSDGSTQVFPLGSTAAANFALHRHYRLVYRALSLGIYQGWDMHPGQLITRYAANYDFFQFALQHAAPRLNRYCERLGGDITDEPATAEALAKIIARGMDADILSLEMVQTMIPTLGVSARYSLEKIIRRHVDK